MSEKKWYLNKKVTLILILATVLLLCGCGSNTPEEDVVTEEAEDTVISSETERFDLEKGTVMLNSGYTMPIIGLGTWTLSNDEAVYKAMEQAVRDGKVRSIGISNYYTKGQVDEVLSYAEITPAVIQNENHLYYQNKALQEYVKQYGIVLESWYPFGGRGHTEDHFGNEVIKELAEKYGKTPAQIILRWHIQDGYVTIPGSSNPEHIEENYDIFDFELTDEDMERIRDLDRQERYENW